MRPLNLLNDGTVLRVPVCKDNIRLIGANHRPVSRHDDDVGAVDSFSSSAAVCAVPVMPQMRG